MSMAKSRSSSISMCSESLPVLLLLLLELELKELLRCLFLDSSMGSSMVMVVIHTVDAGIQVYSHFWCGSMLVNLDLVFAGRDGP